METQQLVEKLSPVVKKYWLPIILGVLGLIFLGYGLIGLSASQTSDKDIVLEKAVGSEISNESKGIFIDIEGAVISPGVYELPQDSRIKDLIIKAGGLSESADRAWFSKNVNLASKLSDGGKLYIPSEGEQSNNSQVSQAGGNVMGTSTSLININSASESQLDSLSGVGPATATKIINNRPYQGIEELLSKKAVTSKVFENIKDKISTY